MAAIAVLTVACGTGGGSTQGASTSSAGAGNPSASSVPPEVLSRGALRVGVKCDYPPFGFIGEDGTNQGFDVDVARQLAKDAFGSPDKVDLQCTTSANRIPYLTTNRVDVVIATLGYNKDRDSVIDYSTPYFSSTGRLLVTKASHITGTADMSGKTVLLSKGTPYVQWFQQCMPDVKRIEYDTASQGLSALLQGRGAAYVDDDTLLVTLAKKNHDLAVVGKTYSSVWGLGMRQGDTAMKTWVDAELATMKQNDQLWKLFTKWVKDPASRKVFAKSMPRPDNDMSYPTGALFTCP